jgi:hypothetical protein
VATNAQFQGDSATILGEANPLSKQGQCATHKAFKACQSSECNTNLSRLAKALKQWSKSKLAMIKQESAEAAQLVLQLDQQQDSRQLTNEEIRQRKIAKSMILGLAAVRKIKLR